MRLLQKEHLLIFQSTLPDPRSRAPVTAIARFQSTLPERGETAVTQNAPLITQISIHSPHTGRDQLVRHEGKGDRHFNPLSPHGERHGRHVSEALVVISIHSPRMGRDRYYASGKGLALYISIHSPRMGRDPGVTFFPTIPRYFNPLSPHGERHQQRDKLRQRQRFQSTLPAWGETILNVLRSMIPQISIHSPRMGRDGHWRRRVGCCAGFQSTLPAWGETIGSTAICEWCGISIHSPRMGRDEISKGLSASGRISIHSPRMGRDQSREGSSEGQPISIHSPRMGRDAIACMFHIPNQTISIHSSRMGRDASAGSAATGCWKISIHSPRMGRDITAFPCSTPCINFNPLSPHGERQIPWPPR